MTQTTSKPPRRIFTTSLRIDLLEKVKKLADARGVDMNIIIEEALEKYFNDLKR